MTVEFSDLKPGNEYLFNTHLMRRLGMPAVPCTFIASHPHDGAYLIIEITGSDDDEENGFFGCVREELELKP